MLTAEAALQSLSDSGQSSMSYPSEPSGTAGLPRVPGRGRLESKVLDVEMDQCAAHLSAIHHTTEVAKQVVAVLADAGSRLQRSGAPSMKSPPAPECDEAMAAASRCFLDACGGLGAVLIGMASAISQNVMLPLESFHRNAFADHARKAKALDDLRRRELSCSNAVTEALQKRDRARVGLQSAMRDQEKTEKKATEKKKSSLASRFRGEAGDKDMAAAELKMQKAATAQTASIEELAMRTEEANEARVVRETASTEVKLLQNSVDFVRSRLLARCLKCCAGAWAEAAKEIQQGAEQLRVQVNKLRSSLDGAVGGLPELPAWAMEALKLSKSRPYKLSELNLDDAPEEDHPESPFTAPSPSLRSPISGSPLLENLAAELSRRDGKSPPPGQFGGWFQPPAAPAPAPSATAASTPFD